MIALASRSAATRRRVTCWGDFIGLRSGAPVGTESFRGAATSQRVPFFASKVNRHPARVRHGAAVMKRMMKRRGARS